MDTWVCVWSLKFVSLVSNEPVFDQVAPFKMTLLQLISFLQSGHVYWLLVLSFTTRATVWWEAPENMGSKSRPISWCTVPCGTSMIFLTAELREAPLTNYCWHCSLLSPLLTINGPAFEHESTILDDQITINPPLVVHFDHSFTSTNGNHQFTMSDYEWASLLFYMFLS